MQSPWMEKAGSSFFYGIWSLEFSYNFLHVLLLLPGINSIFFIDNTYKTETIGSQYSDFDRSIWIFQYFSVQKVQIGRISSILESDDIDRCLTYKLIFQWGVQMNLYVCSLLQSIGRSSCKSWDDVRVRKLNLIS